MQRCKKVASAVKNDCYDHEGNRRTRHGVRWSALVALGLPVRSASWARGVCLGVWALHLLSHGGEWKEGEPGKRLLSFDFSEGGGRPVGGGALWTAEGPVAWEGEEASRAVLVSERGASLHLPIDEKSNPWFSPSEGQIRFRFRPDWTTGNGPGNWASFLSVGMWTPDPARVGFWALATNPKGNRLIFSGQKVGQGKTFFSVPIHFEKGQWYDILLVYSAFSSRVYVNGTEYGPGSGVITPPSSAVLHEYGIRVGNNHHGNQPIQGALAALRSYPAPVTGFVQRKDRYALAQWQDQKPVPSMLRWPTGVASKETVWRRQSGDLRWQVVDTVTHTNQYEVEAQVSKRATSQTYAIGGRRLAVSPRPVPVVERRGRVLVAVAQRVALPLRPSLRQFAENLIGDGWEVERAEVPDHSSRRRTNYRRRVSEVKQRIRRFYRANEPGDQVVVLVGPAPIPYSGLRAEDGHTRPNDDHQGAWPCDAFYGDLDGLWSDQSVDYVNRHHRGNSNRPGDGRLDQDYLPSPLEVAVCRIDFSNLPSVRSGNLPSRSSEREAEFLKQYFEKNHAYRHRQNVFEARAVYRSYLPARLWANMDRNAFANGSALYGSAPGALREVDCFDLSGSVEWGFLAGYGAPSSIVSGRYRSVSFANEGLASHAGFVMLYASWSGDWNLTDSFTKSVLLSPRAGLAVMSSLHGFWDLSTMAMGNPLARAMVESSAPPEGKVGRSISILGDATLRLRVLPPVGELRGMRRGRDVRLAWNGQGGTHRYMVYRSKSRLGPFERISGERPLERAEFIDRDLRVQEPVYMVRRVENQETPSGVYEDLSQGVFWESGSTVNPD